MWIRKFQRDASRGLDSPMPTQVVSNEEFIPRPQSARQKEVEFYIREMGDERAKKLGMDRRTFMGSSLGMATCLLAYNRAWGKVFEVSNVESYEKAAYDERTPANEYFVMDVQTHFTNGIAIGFRNSETAKNMGFNLKEDAEAYSFNSYVKEIYIDSETAVGVISGVPGRERPRDADGKVLEGQSRGGGILPSWLMAQSRDKINEFAKSQRAISQGNLAPNHYWDKATNKMDKALTLEQMERELKDYKVCSWKWYCHTDPGRSGNGFQCDDDNAAWFYEESRKRGMRIVSVHKGYSSQSAQLGHLANPKDLEKAALENPDFKFIVYHSAIQHGASEPDWRKADKYDPTTGDFEWHHTLMEIKRRNPRIDNLYPELGSFFNTLIVADPIMCMHGVGKNIKTYGADHVLWGTDCLWWGSPQWSIDAFKKFQISDEMCEKFGYKKITREDRAKIFGLNAAKIYGIDVGAKRHAIALDQLTTLKTAMLERGDIIRENRAYGWVRADD